MSDSNHIQVNEIFQCSRCGFCCQGETTVSLDADDQQRMIDELGLSRAEVAERFWRITGSIVQMQTVEGHCIFYTEGAGCAVHAGRPWRCGQWPLHQSILDDENNFTTISDSCPGINKELSYEEFCQKLRRLLTREGKLIC